MALGALGALLFWVALPVAVVLACLADGLRVWHALPAAIVLTCPAGGCRFDLSCRRLTCVACRAGGYRFGMPCRRPYFLKRPKSKQKVFLLLCCPSLTGKGGCSIFLNPLKWGRAHYCQLWAHPCAPRSKRPPWRFDPTTQDFKKQQKAR